MWTRMDKTTGILLVALLIGAVPVFTAGTTRADPPPSKPPLPKLAGSTWRMEYAVLPAMVERWTFAADGTVSVEDLACQQKVGAQEKWVPSRDTFDWVANERAISIVMNSRIDGRNFSRFIGTIEGDEIKGKMVNNFGLDTKWTLKRVKVLPLGNAQEEKAWKTLAEASLHEGSWIQIDIPEVGKKQKLERVLRSSTELDNALSRPGDKDGDRKSLLKALGREKIDWEKEMLVVIHGGETPRGYRYRVKIESIKSKEKVLVVTYDVVKTDNIIVGKDGGVLVAILPRIDSDVQFLNVSKK